MTRERKAQIATIAILGAALGLVAVKRGGWQASAAQLTNWIPGARPSAPVTPQDTVYRMLDAARDGDVRAYLRCYTGQMDSTLGQIVPRRESPRWRRIFAISTHPSRASPSRNPSLSPTAKFASAWNSFIRTATKPSCIIWNRPGAIGRSRAWKMTYGTPVE
jgi:hypothetical protein